MKNKRVLHVDFIMNDFKYSLVKSESCQNNKNNNNNDRKT